MNRLQSVWPFKKKARDDPDEPVPPYTPPYTPLTAGGSHADRGLHGTGTASTDLASASSSSSSSSSVPYSHGAPDAGLNAARDGGQQQAGVLSDEAIEEYENAVLEMILQRSAQEAAEAARAQADAEAEEAAAFEASLWANEAENGAAATATIPESDSLSSNPVALAGNSSLEEPNLPVDDEDEEDEHLKREVLRAVELGQPLSADAAALLRELLLSGKFVASKPDPQPPSGRTPPQDVSFGQDPLDRIPGESELDVDRRNSVMSALNSGMPLNAQDADWLMAKNELLSLKGRPSTRSEIVSLNQRSEILQDSSTAAETRNEQDNPLVTESSSASSAAYDQSPE
ncbi:hypothetical protein HK405_006280, partial [Cladochytrium tenue]